MDNGESSYRRFIEGDQSAFDELMDAYRDRLIFFIKGSTLSKSLQTITLAESGVAERFFT